MFHQINAHVARFATRTCKIEVTVGASAWGPPAIFVAEAFVQEQVGRELRPVAWRRGDAVAIHSDTEGQAVAGILRVLEHHLGPVEEMLSASELGDTTQFKGDPWLLPAANLDTAPVPHASGPAQRRPQSCPICQANTARWLEAVSEPAWVNYYRCRACGHLWSTPKPSLSRAPAEDSRGRAEV